MLEQLCAWTRREVWPDYQAPTADVVHLPQAVSPAPGGPPAALPEGRIGDGIALAPGQRARMLAGGT